MTRLILVIRKILRPLLSVAMIVVVFFVLKKTIVVRLYPVCVAVVFLAVFGVTLLPFSPQPMVFRLACLQDKTIACSPHRDEIRRYCRKVTCAWCVFFVANGGAALWTALWGSDRVWSVYNGIVAYVLMGLMFTVEYIIRRQVNAKMAPIHTITKFNAASWPLDRVMCYDGTYSGGEKKIWRDFLVDTAKLRVAINGGEAQDWVLHCDDYWYFICAFAALLQCGKRVLLTQNTTPQFLAEVRKPGDGFITDIEVASPPTGVRNDGVAASSNAKSGDSVIASMDSTVVLSTCGASHRPKQPTIYVPTFLSSAPTPPDDEVMTTPPIDSNATQILMFTSGSTGHAKAVHQRMTEFEADNAFVISKWCDEFANRALVSTVSAHHIYGFLFGVSLPFALGVPFRRRRVEYPEEFETLTDRSYMVIAVPAFLKRTVEAESALQLQSPFIFTSGGAVPFDVAQKTASVMGAWPVEVYGSTETSGIAWRVSRDGMEWTPFDNARVWRGDDGCLVIVSPYIKDPAGFATSDLVEMKDDGRFLLLGRADSIVKIEEKRVSLTEVEKRLVQTGLVADAKVIAMEDKRQYLAAAVVLNPAGRDKFQGKRRLEINQYFHSELMKSMENVVIPKRWRYVDAIPCDTQGKRHKEDIEALFATENDHSITDEVVTSQGDGMVQLEVTIPSTSDFFDGHFPEFHLLPAVAQFEVVTRYAKKYLGLQRYVPHIRRIKFSAPILPDTRIALKLEYNNVKGSVAYSLWDAKTSEVYSSGNFSALPQAKGEVTPSLRGEAEATPASALPQGAQS